MSRIGDDTLNKMFIIWHVRLAGTYLGGNILGREKIFECDKTITVLWYDENNSLVRPNAKLVT